MQKTNRELLSTVAAKIGGVSAEKIRTALTTKTSIDDIPDRSISDEDFASQLKNAEKVWPKTLARIQGIEWAKSKEWGSN